MKSFLASVATLLLALGAVRADCQGDNVLRALRNANLGDGPSRFCSSLLMQTATVTSLTTIASISTTVTTLPDAQTSVTETDTVTHTSISTIVFTADAPTVTTMVTSTSTADIFTRAFRRRGTVLPNGEPSELTTYPPDRISSACSCLLGGLYPTTTVVSSVTAVSAAVETQSAEPTSTVTTTFITVVTSSTLALASTTEPPASTKTATSAATTTTVTTQVPYPAVCGAQGGVPNHNTQIGNMFETTLAACLATCEGNSACKCVVWAGSTGICSFHNQYCNVLNPGSSGLQYYDKNCPA